MELGSMKKKALVETNPYLKDPKKRRAGLVSFVFSSTAIETPNVSRKAIQDGFNSKIFETSKKMG
jgi:hypothetical protein